MNIFRFNKKTIFSFNFLSRVIFLLITPIFFQYFVLGFIWHSIYWGVITFVVLIWSTLIITSPLIGRIGCGWFCFFGSASDLSTQHSLYKLKWRKPNKWLRLLMIVLFFSTSIIFYFINKKAGITHHFNFIPDFINLNFDTHYKIVWAIDISIALIFGFLAERRWVCKNLCFVGSMYSVGAKYSRLLPVIDTEKCTLCGHCEKECLVRIPMVEEIKENKGLITNSECILCGKCIEVCEPDAVNFKFIWNRNRHKEKTSEVIQSIRKRNKIKRQNKTIKT